MYLYLFCYSMNTSWYGYVNKKLTNLETSDTQVSGDIEARKKWITESEKCLELHDKGK